MPVRKVSLAAPLAPPRPAWPGAWVPWRCRRGRSKRPPATAPAGRRRRSSPSSRRSAAGRTGPGDRPVVGLDRDHLRIALVVHRLGQGVARRAGIAEQAFDLLGAVEEHHRRAAGAFGELQHQALLPVAHRAGRQPAVALAVAGGADAQPGAAADLLAGVHVEHREGRHRAGPGRAASLGGDGRAGFGQDALEQRLLAWHQQRTLAAVLFGIGHRGLLLRLVRRRLSQRRWIGSARRVARAQQPPGAAADRQEHGGRGGGDQRRAAAAGTWLRRRQRRRRGRWRFRRLRRRRRRRRGAAGAGRDRRQLDRHRLQAAEVGGRQGRGFGRRRVARSRRALRRRQRTDLGGFQGARRQAVEGGDQRAGGGEALGRVLGQQLAQDVLVAALLDRQFRQRLGEVGQGGGERVLAVVGQLAGEDLVEHHAQRVEVGAAVDLLPAGLLRAHVAGVPTAKPTWVNWVLSSIDLAMPKSESTAVPSARNRMLAGFTSRCTRPWECA